jgi:hypothetical protein
MNARIAGVWAALVLVAPVAHANEQTPTVKESPLARVRSQLTHYDLAPQGTLALLPQLAEFTRTLRGTGEAAEAAFLRAAAANDLLFLADFLGNEALRTGLATEFGVPPDGLAPAIARELSACAQGVYREPAQVALSALQHFEPAEQLPVGPSDLRRDGRFLHAAAIFVKDEAAGARFAALAPDPCAGQPTCAAPYADFDSEGRRALAYMQQVSAAAVRLERARGLGDPLFEALAAAVDRDIASLRALPIRLPPHMPGDPRVLMAPGSTQWPAPHVVVFVGATELRYSRLPRVQIGASGDVERVADPAPVFPETAAIPHSLTDSSPPTRSIDELVTAIKAVRGEEVAFRALLVAETGMASALPARALVSLRKAGAQQLSFAACTKDGTLLGAPIRVVIATSESSGETPDLKLRVRLGGYSIDVGHGVTDIPRVRDDAGLHFDVTTLHAQAAARSPRSAAISFMPDVAAEQVLLAMLQVVPSRAPIDLVIQ